MHPQRNSDDHRACVHCRCAVLSLLTAVSERREMTVIRERFPKISIESQP